MENKEALREINRAVSVLGSSVNSNVLKQRLIEKFPVKIDTNRLEKLREYQRILSINSQDYYIVEALSFIGIKLKFPNTFLYEVIGYGEMKLYKNGSLISSFTKKEYLIKWAKNMIGEEISKMGPFIDIL